MCRTTKNTMKRTVVAVVAVVLSASHAVAQPRLTMDWKSMAERLVAQLAPEPGEKILLVARPGHFEQLIPPLRYALRSVGAVDLGVIDVIAEPYPSDWDGAVLDRARDSARTVYREMLREFAGAIMLPGARPDHAVYAALQDLLREGVGRTIHFHWTQNGSAFPVPGQPMPNQSAIDATYQRALLDTDYGRLAETQRYFADAMRNAEVRVTTPLGTDLTFRVGNRPVNFGDGDASKVRTDQGVILIDREIELPAGAIRVAPVEETVNGSIAFPPSQWDGRPVSACFILASRVKGREITTVEGLGKEGALHPVQEAFIEQRALQGGYCTPGFVLTVKALLEENPSPTREAAAEYLEGNLCRCGCYPDILRAVEAAKEAKD